MRLGGKGIRKFKLEAENSLKLHMFIDSSVMEIYYQNGIETTTFTYFPEKGQEFKMQVKSDNEVKINECSIWNLRRINYE